MLKEDKVSSNNLSAQKRVRQSQKRRAINKALKNSIKTQYKKVVEEIKAGKASAKKTVDNYISMLDKAVIKNILHINNANRHKSRIMKMLQSTSKKKKENVKTDA